MARKTKASETGVSQELRVKMLSDLLTEEIRSAESANARPGWTTWALLAAIASVSWRAVGMLQDPGLNWIAIALVIVASSTMCDLTYIIATTLTADGNCHGRKIRLRLANSLGPAVRLFYLAAFLREAFVLWVLWGARGVLPQSMLWLTLALPAAGLVAFAQMFVYSFMEYPLEAQLRFDLNEYLAAMVAILFVLPLPCYLLLSHMALPIPETKLGLLVSVLMVLLLVLARAKRQSPFLSPMRDIQRRFCLGQLDYESAVSELDPLLYGMTVEAALQPGLARYLSWSTEIRAQASHLMDRIEEAFTKHNPDSDAIADLKVLSRKTVQDIHEMMGEFRREDKSLRSAMSRIGRLSTEHQEQLMVLVGRLERNETALSDELDAAVERTERALAGALVELATPTD